MNKLMKIPISINISKEDLKLIDEAASLERRTRSSFLNIAGLERAKKHKHPNSLFFQTHPKPPLPYTIGKVKSNQSTSDNSQTIV